MGVEARLQPSNPPKPLTDRTAYVQLNALNTIVIPHDPKDVDANKWAFATNDPPSQPKRTQRVADNEVVYFIDGAETLPQFQWEIEKTNGKGDFIYLLGWYLDVDLKFPDFTSPDGVTQTGKTMREMLTAAGKRKVQIRAMIDGQYHDISTNKAAIEFILYGLDSAAGPPAPPAPNPPPPYELIERGISRPNPEYRTYMNAYNEKYKDQIAARQEYLRKSRRDSPDHPDTAGVSDRYFASPIGTHHQKILVVMHDGVLTAFCGGVDINSDRIFPSTEAGRPMHDVHCRIRGPAAWDLLQIFLDRWDDYVSRSQDEDEVPDPLDFILADKKSLRGQNVASQPHCGKFSVQIARTTGHMVLAPYKFAPKGERSVRELVHTGIRQAKRFIYIEDQYLVSIEVARWLSLHLGQIKHLTILVPPPDLTSPAGYVNLRRDFIDELMKGKGAADKVRVFCRNQDTTTCSTYIHAKTYIFDDKLAIIGSANCNNRGMTHDSEVVAGIFDPSSDDRLTYTLPHRLRMQLWAHHLGLDDKDGHGLAELADGVASADLWKEVFRPASAKIIDYYAPPGYTSAKEFKDAAAREAQSGALWWAEDPYSD